MEPKLSGMMVKTIILLWEVRDIQFVLIGLSNSHLKIALIPIISRYFLKIVIFVKPLLCDPCNVSKKFDNNLHAYKHFSANLLKLLQERVPFTKLQTVCNSFNSWSNGIKHGR